MPILLESRESSSPIITRAVANGLLGKRTEIYEFSRFEKTALEILGHLPGSVSEWLIPRIQPANAFDEKTIENLSISDLVSQRLNDYSNLKGKFPAITVGIGMGGTTAHLALGSGGPFLPQAFVLTMKKGTIKGDIHEYFQLSQQLAKKITKNNPGLMTIQHYDPVHDGWLVKRVNHLRLKLIELPNEYKKFIQDKLIPGGEVIYLEGKAEWKRFRVGERNVFQVGGWGDISADEFINGSERLAQFCRKENLDWNRWSLPEYPVESGPESEWGSEPGLGEALEMFCKLNNYKFIKISFSDPNDFNRLAFFAHLDRLKLAGKEPTGTLVEMFTQFDTESVLNSGLLPLWLIFNTNDSLRFLESMVKYFPVDKPVFLSLLSTFSRTPDLVMFKEWNRVLNNFRLIQIGARKNHYPADTSALVGWKKPLENWAEKNQVGSLERISGIRLKVIAEEIKQNKFA